MYNYSIMSVDNGAPEDIAADILRLYRDGIADLALMCFTLVPEGNPPFDKVAILSEKYITIRDLLAKEGAELGILVQASIGHGWVLNHMHPFQRITNFSDGTMKYAVCPLDEGFLKFFYGQMQEVAALKPKVIMIDDDFRLLNRGGAYGCGCPNHMALFNSRAGTSYTREQLWEIVRSDTEEGKRCAEIFTSTQRDALVEAAKVYRAGIDSVDPSIPGLYCTVSGEFAAEIAKVLAGKGNPVIVRLNNGRYTAPGARGLTFSMLRAAFQIATLSEPVDAVLAETDTCPQNRYSTGAQQLHSHFTGTLLEGASGAKHWITRLHAWEPASGEAYRRILSKYSGFYREVSRLAASSEPVGCRIPMPEKWHFSFKTGTNRPKAGFAVNVLERMGLPLYFSKKPGGSVFIDGDDDDNFSDEQILEMLKGNLFLAGETALKLQERGFGKYLGVSLRPWNGERTSGELLPNGNTCSAQVRSLEVIPSSPATKADSTVYNLVDGKIRVPLFPGVTVYDNELGGHVVVFSGTPNTNYNIVEAFSFLNESRKAQLMGLLADAGTLPVCYAGDAELYLRAAKMEDGGLLAALFELSIDRLEDIPLNTENPVVRVERLMPDGSRSSCAFTCVKCGERYKVTVDSEVFPLDPVVLFLYSK